MPERAASGMPMLGRVVAAALVLLGLGGCHSIALGAQPFSRGARDAAPHLIFDVEWRVELVGPRMWEFHPREPARPALDRDTGRVIVLTRDGRARSINPDGRMEWEFKTDDPFLAGATVHEGIAYVPGGDGTLYALRVRDGSLSWKYEAGEQLATAPVVADGRVFVLSHANTLFAVDAPSGRWLWQYRRDLPAGFMVHGAGAPTLSRGVLYAGFSDGFLVALDPATGAAKWERALSSAGKEFLDVDASPIVDEAGRLIAASYKDGIYALEPETGEVVWNTVGAGITGTLERGEVVFTTGARGISAVLAENGRMLWSFMLDERAAYPPAYLRGMLLVPVEQALLFLDPATGRPRLRWDPGQGVSAPPTGAARRLYVLSNSGYLYALRWRGRGG
jgi:outer membrane protein assembly factor BamB